MTITERVQEVFNKFNVKLTVSEEPRTELAEAALDNGTVIYTDAEAFAEGVEAYIINDEGEKIPLPPGDYTLADGRTLVIGEGGVVSSIAEAPAEEAPVEEVQAEEEKKEEDEEKKEMEGTAITREEVAIMIAEAIAALQNEEPEAVAEAVAEEADVVAELKAVKAELAKLNKKAAEAGLKHKAPSVRHEPLDLSKLTLTERVAALHNQFSSK